MFDELAEHNVNLVIDPFVRFEVLRFAENRSEREDLKTQIFQNLFNDEDFFMPTADKDLYDLAIKISNLYQAEVTRSSKISAVDIFLAARMIAHDRTESSQNLFFATENHADFPQIIFDRIDIHTIDRKDQIHNVGFYKVKENAQQKLD